MIPPKTAIDIKLLSSTDTATRQYLEKILYPLGFQDIEDRSISGYGESIMWFLSLAATSPVLVEFIKILPALIKEHSSKRKIEEITISREGTIIAKGIEPEDLIHIIQEVMNASQQVRHRVD